MSDIEGASPVSKLGGSCRIASPVPSNAFCSFTSQRSFPASLLQGIALHLIFVSRRRTQPSDVCAAARPNPALFNQLRYCGIPRRAAEMPLQIYRLSPANGGHRRRDRADAHPTFPSLALPQSSVPAGGDLSDFGVNCTGHPEVESS